MFISIIIPTYNRAQYIGITLDSFLEQTYPADKYEIIVCDNNSSDHTREIVKEYEKREKSKIHYLFEKRQGVHYARNKAAKEAKGELLYFTDDDMIADKRLLEELASIFDHNDVGCASGKVLPKWEVTPPKWIKKHCTNFLLSLIDLGDENKISEIDMGVFSCHEAIRREVFFATGGFHPENTAGVWIGDGESGLNEDIRRLGWKFGYAGKAVIYHMIPQKRMTQKYLNDRFRNTAACVAYSNYRKEPFEKKQFHKKVRSCLWDCLKTCRMVLSDAIRGITTIRFIPAAVCYYTAYIKYIHRIVNDDIWRKFVMKNDYLNDSESV